MSNTNESISAKLRRWADESENNRRLFYPTFNACDDLGIKIPDDDCVSERELFRKIADEVDAELESTRDSMRYKSLIPLDQVVGEIANGSDEYDELKAAIDRYYLPRPLFDDGEPVQFGDMFVRDFGRDAKIDSLSYTKGNSDYVNINGYERHDFAHRLKRPKPQVLDADGVPIMVGDTVWYSLTGKQTIVQGFRTASDGDLLVSCELGLVGPSNITHREPDSQERIDRDAMKGEYEYWGCTGSECHNCPALVDGMKPSQRYGILWCGRATRLDLLRRQRDLDGRDV